MRMKKQIPPMLRKPSKINAFDITQKEFYKKIYRLPVWTVFFKNRVKFEYMYNNTFNTFVFSNEKA